ncbi:hypothetical protein IW261DRAFT_1558925 [Armillaria novae-zelandiae]|uniref:Mid2 domain-containing protein n=1 Tax=Armillaria novae-zelandiae TaxID=153914 RepID=A0AA39PPY7_9AGAR|nr:hypothetical protein IW261DRAFT_1558925 [Armillaria novae-zelandiae]
MTFLLQVLFGLSFLLSYSFAQDHIQCVDSGLDWYTSIVGETPCRTYQRLRQICNSNYVLGALNPNTPPDTCGDQVADCCCNSIAFGLSMLCLTCQQGVGPNGNGVDAGIGAYQTYLKHGTDSFCTPNTNKSFTNDIQTAVCNNGLKIHNSFYDAIFWADGSWFYTWSREQMEKTDAADGNNPFTHCTSVAAIVTSSSQSSQSMSPSSSTSPSQSTSDSNSLSTSLSQSISIPPPDSTSLSQSIPISLSQSMSFSRSQPTSLSQSASISRSNITSLTESTSASAATADTPAQTESSSKSLSAGAVAGIVVGSVAFIWAITLSLVWLVKRRQREAAIENLETSARPFSTVLSSDLYISGINEKGLQLRICRFRGIEREGPGRKDNENYRLFIRSRLGLPVRQRDAKFAEPGEFRMTWKDEKVGSRNSVSL